MVGSQAISEYMRNGLMRRCIRCLRDYEEGCCQLILLSLGDNRRISAQQPDSGTCPVCTTRTLQELLDNADPEVRDNWWAEINAQPTETYLGITIRE